MRKKELLSLNVNTGAYKDFVGHLLQLAEEKESKYTCFANVHMLIEGYNDPVFASIVNNANLIAPDGKALTWALRLLYGIKQDRVAGMDVMPDLMQRAVDRNLSVYFYGGTDEMMVHTKSFVGNNYPNLKAVGYYSPPFHKDGFTPQDYQFAIEDINRSGAHLVFVILGCPKQEKWMAAMRGKINAVMLGVGGALSVTIGLQKRAPKWMQRAGMEWFFRLVQEPNRLFKRYAFTNPLFIYLLFREYFKIKLSRKSKHLGIGTNDGLVRRNTAVSD